MSKKMEPLREPYFLGHKLIHLSHGRKGRTNGPDKYLLRRSHERSDTLFTSSLVLGEILAGARKVGGEEYLRCIRAAITEMGFSYLPFQDSAVDVFSWLRDRHGTKIADSIHLACASSAGMDLFVTGDTDLPKLDVPGIQFVVDYQSAFF